MTTKEPSAPPPRQRSSLRRKFIQTILIVSSMIGGTTLAIVLLLSARTSARHLRDVEASIEEGITSKGKVLTENHALALRGMVLDNAFLDMQALVARAVAEDPDLVYGLFVNAAGETLAFRRRGNDNSDPGSPSKGAWLALGLTRDDVVVRQESVRRLLRLGQEVVEVAVPVVSDDREVLGTIRYALSTERMHRAIVAAAADSKAQQLRSVELVGAVVGIATALGIVLGRIQAVRITRPVQALTRAAIALAEGDRSVCVTFASGDELQTLGFAFNRMVVELSNSYEALESLNRTLEQKVERRTLELAGRNRDMRLVLDNVDQGFVTLSPDGTMTSERSAVVDRWFGGCVPAQTLWEYLARTSCTFAAEFELAWEQLAADMLPLEVAIAQLPSRLIVNGSTFHFRYLPFMRDQGLEGILVVVADITGEVLREREEVEFAELMQGLQAMMRDRSGFAAFLSEASAMVDLICEPSATADAATLKNTLHTLKGSAGQMGLSVVASLCHMLEDELTERDQLSVELCARLSSRWQSVTSQVDPFIKVGEPNPTLQIEQEDYATLISLMSRNSHDQALQVALSWQLEPASRGLRRLADQAKTLARRLGKGDLNVNVESTCVRIEPKVFGPFFADLGHIARNAVDHGIEFPEERRASGKPTYGRLSFSVRQHGHSLIFEVSDDGSGIDWDAVRQKGSSLGLPCRTAAELLAVLCRQGITTRSVATQTSGRGVGMSAVKQRVEAMHGTLEVESTRGFGTTWRIIFPWAPEQVMHLRQLGLANILQDDHAPVVQGSAERAAS